MNGLNQSFGGPKSFTNTNWGGDILQGQPLKGGIF